MFSIDVTIYATAYIKADSDTEALAKLAALSGAAMALRIDRCPDFDLAICDLPYQAMGAKGVADVTLSSAMTFNGPVEGDELQEPEVS